MIFNTPELNTVRYAISLGAYSLWRARYRSADQRIAHWYREFCESLAFPHDQQWPDIVSKDNPMLCEFCGTQIGTHWSCATAYKGHKYANCCRKLQCGRLDEVELFWQDNRLHITSAIAVYMNVPRDVIEHCLAIELLHYINLNRNSSNERKQISSSDANGFELIDSLC